MTSRSGQGQQAVVAVGGAKWPRLNGRFDPTPQTTRRPPDSNSRSRSRHSIDRTSAIVQRETNASALERDRLHDVGDERPIDRTMIRERRPFKSHRSRVRRTLGANLHSTLRLRYVLGEVRDRCIDHVRGQDPGSALCIGRTGERCAQVRAQHLPVREAERTCEVFRPRDRAIDLLCIGHTRTVAYVRSFMCKGYINVRSYVRTLSTLKTWSVVACCENRQHVVNPDNVYPPCHPPNRGFAVGEGMC